MMSTKNNLPSLNYGANKYETTAIISEEGLRSDMSLRYQHPTIQDVAREEKNIEELHFMKL